MFNNLVTFIREQFHTTGEIPLHAPVFMGNEVQYVVDTIATSYVSSVGEYVCRFESNLAQYTSSPGCVAVVNGTSGLHVALKLVGVGPGDLVLTQALTFVATCNAILYCSAEPVFIDVDKDTLGLSHLALKDWLEENAILNADGDCVRSSDRRQIKACLAMHTFGHPVAIDELLELCDYWNLPLIEDAAESLGSFYKGKHTGTFGALGVLSFNGNKIITTGGGGALLSNQKLALRAKHLTTTAKSPHAFEFYHDELGFNYRMPNLNAALGCAQLELLEQFIEKKRKLAENYRSFFEGSDMKFVAERAECRSNYWLNAVICEDRKQRDALLEFTNNRGVMTRPIWKLMTKLPYFSHYSSGSLSISEWLEERIVNLPSGVTISGAIE